MSNSNSEYPEDRPKDQNGVPVRTPHQAEQDKIREARIAREQAEIARGFASQPVAGHRRNDGDRGR
jgi:hypothetical protein